MEIRNSDRRQNSISVDTDRRSGVDRRENPSLFYALEAVPTFRRTLSIPDKIEHGETATALGMASLALINLPEDISDIKGAINQLKGAAPKYDYTKCQHPFSFFRGTMLKDFANPNKSNNPKLAQKILNSDKSLAQTNFGIKFLNRIGVGIDDIVETKIHSIGSTKENPLFVSANVYNGSKLGKLTAHAMERTTKWGLVATALLETPRIAKAFCKGDGIFEKGENGSKQVVKSAINVASITAGIGYIGAIGHNKFGAIGSLVGMGAGAILGGYVSKKIQDAIS